MAPTARRRADNADVMPDTENSIDRQDALHVLAVMGDLSMGQPIDHSRRVAALSAAMAQQLGWDTVAVAQVQQIALLRWSGCTANAAEITATLGDDVSGRAAMLALQFDKIELLVPQADIADRAAQVSAIHCEVSQLVADTLALDTEVSDGLGCVFEHWDGSGHPGGLKGGEIPASALVVSVCSELEILARTHGLASALHLLRQRADVIHPPPMVDCAIQHAVDWLAGIEAVVDKARVGGAAVATTPVDIGLIGHVIDLKLPWLMGHSRSVVDTADAIATSMGLAAVQRIALRQAAWLHGLGRVAIASRVWNRAGPLTTGEWEQVRLAPYWTSRAARQVGRLTAAAELASHAFERLDGTGYFRGLSGLGLPIESRILSAAVAWTALRADRPWRQALNADAAMATLVADGAGALFDRQVITALQRFVQPQGTPRAARAQTLTLLTAREREVLRRISLGDSNKEAAKHLDISPATVRTHLESVFRKLDCRTRAACTLRASLLGLLDD